MDGERFALPWVLRGLWTWCGWCLGDAEEAEGLDDDDGAYVGDDGVEGQLLECEFPLAGFVLCDDSPQNNA